MKTLLSLSFVTLSCFAAGCVAGDAPDRTSTAASTEDELTDFNEADLVTLDADHVVYPARHAKSARVLDLIGRSSRNAEPVYLVGNRASSAVGGANILRSDAGNRNGYLRKVIGVETAGNGDVIFATQKASLSEAKHELSRKGFVTLGDQGQGDGCFPHAVNPFDLYNVDLSRVLYEKNIGSIGKMSIRLKDSFLAVGGNLETQVSGACLHPTDAKGVLTLNMKGQVVLEGSFDGAFGAATGEIPLFHEQVAITSVLGYPLALDFSVTAECDFSSNGKVRAEVGAKVSGSIAAGATWVRREGFDASLTPTWSPATAIGPSFTANATVTATCTVRTKALALIFDSDEGPYAEAATSLALEATGSGTGAGGSVRAKGTLGVDVGIGGTLKPFHVTLIDQIEAPRFQKQWPLFDRTFPIAGH